MFTTTGQDELISVPKNAQYSDHVVFEVKGTSAARFQIDATNVSFKIQVGGLLVSRIINTANTVIAKRMLENLISANEFHTFWLSWHQGHIRIGRGEAVGANQFLSAEVGSLDDVSLKLWTNQDIEWRLHYTGNALMLFFNICKNCFRRLFKTNMMLDI